MRIIKFRGILLNESQAVGKGWIYGTPVFLSKTEVAIHPFWKPKEIYLVKKETLGEFIGLEDKNVKEIYEGDIVKLVKDKDQEKSAEHMQGTGVVGFDLVDLTFGWSKSIEGRPYSLLTWGGTKSVEVIGNIYFNPELLK